MADVPRPRYTNHEPHCNLNRHGGACTCDWLALQTAAPVAAPAAPLDALYTAIAHGDAEHRAWLKEALTAFYAGKPAPPARLKLPSEGPTLRFNAEPPEDCPCASQCLHVGNCLGKCSAATRAAPSEGPTRADVYAQDFVGEGALERSEQWAREIIERERAAPTASEGPTRAEVEFAETGLIDGEATCPACGKRGWHECPANAAARADAGAEDDMLIAATLRKRFHAYQDGLMNQAAARIESLSGPCQYCGKPR